MAQTPPALTLHVATHGNDRWTGRLAAPNANKTDGPLASLDGARDAIRHERAQTPALAATVLVHGGTYRLDRTFVLEPADSGTSGRPVIYAAAPNERPIISGGRMLTGFQQRGQLWECEIPEVKSGQWYFRQLFVNGQRRQRARVPNEGYFRIAGNLPGGRDAQGKAVPNKDGFIFKPADIQSWARLSDVNIILMHSWETSIHPVKSVDVRSNAVTFTAPLKEWWTIGYWEKAQRYYVENAFEGLDQPGEWYLNRETGVLSYYPMPGERLGETEIVAPVLSELVRFQGDPDKGRFVQHVALQGLTFHHADWLLDPKGNSSTQAAVETPAAVMADGAQHCTIERCEIAHVGTYGLWLRRGCKDSRVAQNRLFDLGAGGVRVGEDQMAKNDVAESSRNQVVNNHIYDGGRVYAAGVGVWVAQSSHNRIAHNEIHDLLYSGISIGWNWNDATNRTHHNVIEYNHVHHLVHGVLSDAGLIYCLGASPGSVIRNNVFHDIWPYATPPFGWGIYLDATCSGYRVESNLVYHTQSGGLMYNNGGHEHVIQNNIFALSATHALWPFFEPRTNNFRRNIVYLTQGEMIVPHAESPLQQRLAAKEPLCLWDQNLYWHIVGEEHVKFLRRTFADWQALGLDRRSVIADPKFMDAAALDFRLSPESPALALGFQPIDTSRVGLYGDSEWGNEARQVKHAKTVLPPPPAPPGPQEIDDGFESTVPGAHPHGWHVDGEGQGASIRITQDQAASGKHALQITDSYNVQPSWQPHFYCEPHFTRGIARQSFDVRLTTNATFFTEWRDTSSYPENVGPTLWFDGQGRVTTRGKLLTTLPLDRWVRVEIEASVGKKSSRQFTATFTIPGVAPQIFRDLPFAGRNFTELHWLGFSSTATMDSVFYLDNLKVRTEVGR